MSDPSPAPHPPAPARSARRGNGVLWLLLLGVLAVAAWQGWQWWREQADARAGQAGQVERLASLEARLDALRRDQRANAERLQQSAATNRLLREELLGLGQRAALLEDSVADLADAGAGGIRSLRLDEADLLLATAAQRLLAGDVDGARRAYALAATVLERLDDPDILDVRQALAQERAVLDALGPDPAAAARDRLAALEAALPALPERVSREAPASAPWWRRLAAKVIDVRPSDGAAVIAPTQRAIGLAAVQLELALARAALERRDPAAFDAALARIDNWLQRLWPDSAPLREQRQAIRGLQAMPIRMEAPELGSTLAQLRRLRGA
ncbi:MAG TPA: uroporphyrinogen-III C-methyltransferase [Xanthomonadaceae bacterium]|nr:uroporphyrinogen-III C-methyltransferase [Xanthomonadaceae bacterium]